MFSFDINIRIHSVFHAKCAIGRKFDDAVVQSDLHFLSSSSARQTNPNFVEYKRICTWCHFSRPFLSLIFIYFKSLEEISSMVLLKMKETTEANLGTTVNNECCRYSPCLYFNDSQDGHERRRNHLGNERSLNHQRADGCCDRLRSRSQNHW